MGEKSEKVRTESSSPLPNLSFSRRSPCPSPAQESCSKAADRFSLSVLTDHIDREARELPIISDDESDTSRSCLTEAGDKSNLDNSPFRPVNMGFQSPIHFHKQEVACTMSKQAQNSVRKKNIALPHRYAANIVNQGNSSDIRNITFSEIASHLTNPNVEFSNETAILKKGIPQHITGETRQPTDLQITEDDSHNLSPANRSTGQSGHPYESIDHQPPSLKTVTAVRSWFSESKQKMEIPGLLNHHDHTLGKSARPINVLQDASEFGEILPPPWDDLGVLDAEYLEKKTKSGSGNRPASEEQRAERVPRILWTDEDARRLHSARSQHRSELLNFEQLLETSSVARREKILYQLKFKGIKSLPFSRADVSGNSHVILTSITDGPHKFRRIHFFQSGSERREFTVFEESSQFDACFCTCHDSTINNSSSRFTSSFLDTIQVEDQLVEIFCEQIERTKVTNEIRINRMESCIGDSCPLQNLQCSVDLCGTGERNGCTTLTCCFMSCVCPSWCKHDTHAYSLVTTTRSKLIDMITSNSRRISKRCGDEWPMVDAPTNQVNQMDTATAEVSSYVALVLRYREKYSHMIRETVALLDPSEDINDLFRFVMAASPGAAHQHTEIKPCSGTGGCHLILDPADSRESRRLRAEAEGVGMSEESGDGCLWVRRWLGCK